jgi:hypothetical protein
MQDYMPTDVAKVSLDFKGLISEKYNENNLQHIFCVLPYYQDNLNKLLLSS